VPSFSLLYSFDEPLSNPAVTLKIIGHQWYWSYEYSDFEYDFFFSSYMVDVRKPEGLIHVEDANFRGYRLLEVDKRVLLPVGVAVRLLITSNDVLHSWAVPAFAVKSDAIPGRLNQIIMVVSRPGVYYGQCSELCGINHGFMPIVIECVDLESYIAKLTKKL